jgi:ABC-type phosphate/phosphonate transport system substrate-binding protein
LPENIKAALKNAITTIPREDNKVTAFGNITGWEVVNDSDYALIRDVKKVIDGLN